MIHMTNVVFKDTIEVVNEAQCRSIEVIRHVCHGDLGVLRHPGIEGADQVGLPEPVFKGFDPQTKIIALLQLIIS
jgi:hypothetical protein